MRTLVDAPPLDFTSTNAAAFTDLGVESAHLAGGTPRVTGTTAIAAVTERLRLRGAGTIAIRTDLHLVQRSGTWMISWSPTTIDPHLAGGDSFSVTTSWPGRAPILGADGTPLVTTAQMVEIGVEGSYVTDATTLTAALVTAGATPTEVSSALAAAKAHPTYFEPVFEVSQARYLELKATIYPIPGTVFDTTSARAAITPGLAAHLVGTVGPITAQQLAALGSDYNANSIVGQTGLEEADEQQLAGKPGYTVTIDNASGATVATVASVAPVGGRPVRTSIDPTIQRAAEAALAHVNKHAALIAVRASTGQILASVSDPSNDDFDQSLDGSFPPGSTFKTITSTALIDAGLSPSSAATCPPTISAGGEVFHNAEGDAPVTDLAGAFTESCNTAFIGLAFGHLDAANLPAAASLYGIGSPPKMGIPAAAGVVPTPTDAADLAATAIGQAQVLVSPLNMAMVAAAIDSGVVHAPRLVEGAPDDAAPTQQLSSTVVADLHQMMADVVASGTAAHEGLPAGTFAKTGTAEYGPQAHLKTDAWLIGFRGDIAFAILVVNGGFGGPTDGPIAANFLTAIAAEG